MNIDLDVLLTNVRSTRTSPSLMIVNEGFSLTRASGMRGIMGQDWIKGLGMSVLVVNAALALSGCNTIAGVFGGLGRDISAIGDGLADISGSECDRCGKRKRRAGRYVTRGR